ncbi:hypothetical protein DHW03_18940 [Pedobacter yonginense]|uniref:Uncharacterized protein n=1 Tax=Pedobacter yonginense TaxID=651869 RepID=A0A317EGG9_9SPHI|nr:hypothetical protein [Pedobacter yonginense]PWS25910.1 hypothetical protein DHW03_18940 [Pedobacter yonginense]
MENEIAKYENNKIIDVIKKIPDLTDQEKTSLIQKVLSDDVAIRNSVLTRLADSQIAINDLVAVQGEITALNKQGMYIKAKQTIKTGSGNVEIEMKGGDAKLIIPVLVILGIIIIAVLAILFMR